MAATFAEFDGAAARMGEAAGAYASGEWRREYCDHRLEWMVKSGGIDVAPAGLRNNTIVFPGWNRLPRNAEVASLRLRQMQSAEDASAFDEMVTRRANRATFGPGPLRSHHDQSCGINDAVWAIGVIKEHGLDLADLSLGINTDDMKEAPFNEVAFMVERGSRVRREIGIPVGVSWNLGLPTVADQVIREELIDLVFLGRPALSNPHWPVWAARELSHNDPFSSNWTPFSLKSSEPRRIVNGKRSHTERTASNASRWNRRRFSRLPPYSSVRWLASGEKKLAPR